MRLLCCILTENFKKFTVLIFLLLSSFLLNAQVVINELGIKPSSNDAASGSEFIELFNRGTGSVNIGCYVIVFSSTSSSSGNPNGWSITIPPSTTLACGSYYLIGGAGATVSGTVWGNTNVGGASWVNVYGANGKSPADLDVSTSNNSILNGLRPGNLSNTKGQVNLYNAAGGLVYSVQYNSGNTAGSYPATSNSSSSCGTQNFNNPGNSVNNVTTFTSSDAGIYLDNAGVWQTETTLTPGRSNALNTTDGASQIASTCCVNPTITTQPSTAAQSLCLNAASTPLIVVATPGSGTIASNGYQWYRNTTASNTGGTIISGATSSTYTPPTTAVGTTYYYCVVTNTTGCSTTSNVSGAVIIKAATSSTTTISNCTSYTWNGVTYTTSGTYTKTLVNAAGCDSVATLNLTIKQPTSSTTTISKCTSYTWNGVTYTTSGTYTKTLVNAAGCDSVATLNLTIKQPTSSTTTISNCTSYTWNGVTYTTSGTYTKILVNAAGCDSVATLNLTIKQPTTSTPTISNCTSYTWNGVTYTTSGTYTKTLVNAVGCDSIATLILTIKATSASTTTVSVCPSGLPFIWNGTSYSTAGTYTKTLTNSAGCDSIATLVLSINAVITTSTSVSICPNALPYIWNGTSYSTAGSFSKTFTSITGCDSIVTLVLTVKPTSTSSTAISICANALPYTWNGISYSAAGTYTKTLVNAIGCDSTATLVLTVKATSTNSTSISVCPSGLPYTWNGTSYSTAGTYTKTFTNAAGCDSIATLVLTVKATSTSSTSVSVCSNTLPYTWNGTAYNAAGTYTKTLTNAAGCDSIATLILTLKAISTSTTSVSVCSNTLPYIWNATAYNVAGTYTKTLTNAAGCDSIATLVLSIKAASASSTSVSICPSGLPYIWNGTSYSVTGTYTKTLTNAVGCDSIATLVLTVKATSTSTTNINVCPTGLPYTWNGTVYNAAGTYTKSFTNTVGCDSIATLVLTVKQPTTSNTNKTICVGTTYTWNGTVYNAAGTYTKTLTNSAGCDSIATLNLSIETFVITLNAAPIPAYGGATFTATITANAPIASSVWQPSSLFVNNLSSQSIVSPDTSFTLAVTAVSVNGCSSSASKPITVVPSNNVIYIPNALTPAATGTDASVIKVYGTSIKTASLLVYNQWGQLIFQTDSANIKGWDGTFNGIAQPSGVYTYVARIVFQNRKVEVRSGSINLIR